MKREINMSKIGLLVLFAILNSGCLGNSENTKNKIMVEENLVILIYDISKSNDSYANLNTGNIEKLYITIGSNGGGVFYGIHVKSNSNMQDPVMYQVPFLKQLDVKGNPYQQANRKHKNRQLELIFDSCMQNFRTVLSEKFVLPKIHNFSDIKNALEIARNITEYAIYSNHKKSIIIISDLENDLSPVNGIDKMKPVNFINAVNLLLVRPSGRINIPQIIPNVKYSVFTTIDDAISSLYIQKNQ